MKRNKLSLSRLIAIESIEKRQNVFLTYYIKPYINQFKTKKDIEKFSLIFPEWAVGFFYVDALKNILFK